MEKFLYDFDIYCNLRFQLYHNFIITVRNSNCRKVMFSKECVKNSVQTGGV